MEGITVLTEATPIGLGLTILILLSVFFTIAGIGSFLVVHLAEIIGNKIDSGKVIFGLLVSLLIIVNIVSIAFVTGSVSNMIDERDHSYKIMIDDSVSFNEFNAKYKVIKQDGQIFTVVEREVTENAID